LRVLIIFWCGCVKVISVYHIVLIGLYGWLNFCRCLHQNTFNKLRTPERIFITFFNMKFTTQNALKGLWFLLRWNLLSITLTEHLQILCFWEQHKCISLIFIVVENVWTKVVTKHETNIHYTALVCHTSCFRHT
jgi:hypothetical protein